jgi:hypothetical protein
VCRPADEPHQRTAPDEFHPRWCGALHPVNVIGCAPAGDEPTRARPTMNRTRCTAPHRIRRPADPLPRSGRAPAPPPVRGHRPACFSWTARTADADQAADKGVRDRAHALDLHNGGVVHPGAVRCGGAHRHTAAPARLDAVRCGSSSGGGAPYTAVRRAGCVQAGAGCALRTWPMPTAFNWRRMSPTSLRIGGHRPLVRTGRTRCFPWTASTRGTDQTADKGWLSTMAAARARVPGPVPSRLRGAVPTGRRRPS